MLLEFIRVSNCSMTGALSLCDRNNVVHNEGAPVLFWSSKTHQLINWCVCWIATWLVHRRGAPYFNAYIHLLIDVKRGGGGRTTKVHQSCCNLKIISYLIDVVFLYYDSCIFWCINFWCAQNVHNESAPVMLKLKRHITIIIDVCFELQYDWCTF